MKPQRAITDAKVAKALAHPLRVRILSILEERTASPRELAIELDADLSALSYHVRTLHRMGFIELVEQKRRRAALESYYRAAALPVVTREAWVELPGVVKKQLISGVLGTVAEAVNAAAASGGFEGADAHLSRVVLKLDRQGYTEAGELLTGVVGELERLNQEAEERLRASDHQEAVDATAVLMLFEDAPATSARRPASDGAAPAARPRRSTPI